ncbi:hypothetical protein LZ31DRAFT_326923 [Colletotrichum somersetense]|nr:hypothetical protein LZ31DRAFT_326923 [Colletotrichum somersetense]
MACCVWLVVRLKGLVTWCDLVSLPTLKDMLLLFTALALVGRTHPMLIPCARGPVSAMPIVDAIYFILSGMKFNAHISLQGPQAGIIPAPMLRPHTGTPDEHMPIVARCPLQKAVMLMSRPSD